MKADNCIKNCWINPIISTNFGTNGRHMGPRDFIYSEILFAIGTMVARRFRLAKMRSNVRSHGLNTMYRVIGKLERS